jgi:hypothetical protein
MDPQELICIHFNVQQQSTIHFIQTLAFMNEIHQDIIITDMHSTLSMPRYCVKY